MNFIIFGGTGDLAYRKLFPALFNLLMDNKLSKRLKVYGIGSKPLSNEEYRFNIRQSISNYSRRSIDEKLCEERVECAEYLQGDILSDELYMILQKIVSNGKNIYYFAVKPEFFEEITLMLSKYKINNNSKVIVEKPFGWDLSTAIRINDAITSVFPEKNVFRIDHYLGKEMTKNITVLRFANEIFEPFLCSKYVSNIRITISERLGVLDRGRYYDKAGAIKDMLQNHLLQLLCLAVMDKPDSLKAEDIIKEKIKVLKVIKLIQVNDLVIGQYAGYRDEAGVSKDSLTETYIEVQTAIDNDRWRGTHVSLSTGKMLDEKYVKIVYELKNPENSLYELETENNKLVVMIQPSEGVSINFNLKKPGSEGIVENVKMDYCQSCKYGLNTPEAYEKLILDVYSNDMTSFSAWEEVKNSWIFIDSLEKIISEDREKKLIVYDRGSMGPNKRKDKTYETN